MADVDTQVASEQHDTDERHDGQTFHEVFLPTNLDFVAFSVVLIRFIMVPSLGDELYHLPEAPEQLRT